MPVIRFHLLATEIRGSGQQEGALRMPPDTVVCRLGCFAIPPSCELVQERQRQPMLLCAFVVRQHLPYALATIFLSFRCRRLNQAESICNSPSRSSAFSYI